MILWEEGRTKKYFWSVVLVTLRHGQRNFKGDTSGGDGDGLILLTRRCIGPLAFMYFRAPIQDAPVAEPQD
jgi:hypothetical protein